MRCLHSNLPPKFILYYEKQQLTNLIWNLRMYFAFKTRRGRNRKYSTLKYGKS